MDNHVMRVNSLIHKIQKGDERAVDSLFNEFGALFINMAKKYLFDKKLAEDLISEMFLELYRSKAKSFNANFNGLNWIYTIIRNKAYKYNGQNQNSISLDDAYETKMLECVMAVSESDSDQMIDDLTLREALRGLTKKENQLLYYRFWECLTVREIAKLHHEAPSTTHYRIKQALKKLKTLLEERLNRL